ncbi:Rieske (2Fe-2S) protein [Streptomyces sp. AV19]|uniref:Rieske (2Fe-2S) protein n=1 Tax=Streptomyces sp. AV19 TaxID=2793068 RepID=UPI0018FE71D8|nr:Rieske (2Fe-2S) protein [Streptomyces sp. AV19]MBH1936358.1 Rieske (2Fe-2S) protein [Streptomyces sp. AV19]MDG4532396.1 Rieske (2Fe-2S) protein [Streptomyces sp. AV19]
MTSRQPVPCCASRRTVLRGAALAGAAGLGAVACDGKTGARASSTPTAPVELGAASEVPVGGAKLYREERLLVAQPAKGQFKAFSAECTHAGCVLAAIEEGAAACPCHGSRFDVKTGKVLQGPAGDPLPAVPVRAKGGRLVAGPSA